MTEADQGQLKDEMFANISLIEHEQYKQFDNLIKLIEQEQEDLWNGLSKEDQLKVFCAVVRRIHLGEIEKRRSYRGVLYDVFEFEPESYLHAQMAGYLDIHNLLFTSTEQKISNSTAA